jgi:hypothetical protein
MVPVVSDAGGRGAVLVGCVALHALLEQGRGQRAARYCGECLDVVQQIELVQPFENAQMIERRAKAAARQAKRKAHAGFCAGDRTAIIAAMDTRDVVLLRPSLGTAPACGKATP